MQQTFLRTKLETLCLSGLMAFIMGCANAGVGKEPGSTSAPASQAVGADQKPIQSSNVDEGIPINHLCLCKDLVDASSRGAFAVVLNEQVKLLANCIYFDGTNKDHYLSVTVYAGARSEDFEAAVRRARKGYETVSDSRSETLSDGLTAKWFSGVGTKSHVIGSVVQNAAKQVIVESREIQLGASDLPIGDHVVPAVARAGVLAPTACKRP